MKNPARWIHVAVFAGGAAALSWEVVWQLQLSLAMGVSAEGAALTLALTMGGMTLGSFVMGRVLHGREIARPLRAYGLLELAIGLSGVALRPALRLVEHADSALPPETRLSLVQLVGIVVVLGVPTFAMGASLPFFGIIASRYRTRLSFLYGLNTLGAAMGTLLLAFVALPALGVGKSIAVVACVNSSIWLVTWLLPDRHEGHDSATAPAPRAPALRFATSALVVFATGFATFALEVAWFRSLRSAFLSTTSTFAILLAAVLLPLAVASRFAVKLHAQKKPLGPWLAAAAIAILLATPLVERFDLAGKFYIGLLSPTWFYETLFVVGPAMFLLGISLPWVLEDHEGARSWGALYAINTVGAIVGAISAAWVLLPNLGFARTAWCVGVFVLLVACTLVRGRALAIAGVAGATSLGIAIMFESGIGRTRTIGPPAETKLIAFKESADFTVSVVQKGDARELYIDGFVATSQPSAQASEKTTDYMAWMGRLPMLLHPDPKAGLVICFGTGQTSNAVRREGIASLDIVDISQAVFDMAPYFDANENVLGDPRVSHHRVDGRAWLRRTSKRYDVITLEPMPPTFAGVNALYSKEFYELLSSRLNAGGMAAQWLPFHLVDPFRAASIAATFRAVFPNAVLWQHPVSGTGILLGCKEPCSPETLGSAWPGFAREPAVQRTLDFADVEKSLLDGAQTARFAAPGAVVTDDNQLLAYGVDPRNTHFEVSVEHAHECAKMVDEARTGPVRMPPAPPTPIKEIALWIALTALLGRIAQLVAKKVMGE